MEENIGLEIAREATKEVAKDAYSDAVKPVVQPTGELVGLLPRAIKAALAPVEKWVLQREYNVAETKKLLEEKLSAVPPELIEAPEPHIAVPAIQYISYCMDNEDLRDMYANLLANSMNKVVKNGVHPGFVEIIKQLCPDEAKILKYIMHKETIPIITLTYIYIFFISAPSDVSTSSRFSYPRSRYSTPLISVSDSAQSPATTSAAAPRKSVAVTEAP